jgi:hypothetical protein
MFGSNGKYSIDNLSVLSQAGSRQTWLLGVIAACLIDI